MDKLERFENQLLMNHIEWFKNTTHENREIFIGERVNALSDEGYRMYCNFCIAHKVIPRGRTNQ